MNDKVKRYLIGCMIPVLATVLVCAIFFHQNAATAIWGELDEEEEFTEGTVTLTTDNWEEYFEYVEEYIQVTNDDGEVERVELDVYYRMKEEYYERFESLSEQVILIVDVDDTFKEYKITDSKIGDWELTGNDSKYESRLYQFYVNNLGNDRDKCFWYPDINKCKIYGDSYYQEFKDEKIVQIINEVEIRTVTGQVTFE